MHDIKILHISFHKGCINEVKAIAHALNLTVTSLFIPDLAAQAFDGFSYGNYLYNIGYDRAQNIWKKHKDYFEQYDVILTSDTVPLSRIFLQNNYPKQLIIWVCNRIDYCDMQSLDCHFPDPDYYKLLAAATDKNNVHFIAYNSFEQFYADQKGIHVGTEVIKPTGISREGTKTSFIPHTVDKKNSFFIPPYLNDFSLDISQKCKDRGITIYQGRYNGAEDLKEFKGIIHIPYAWSNFAFFENMQMGVPYFIPTQQFMMDLFEEKLLWWPDGDYFKDHYYLSEWYAPEHSTIITYFDSWDDLAVKIATIDFEQLQMSIKMFAQQHSTTMVSKWENLFKKVAESLCIS